MREVKETLYDDLVLLQTGEKVEADETVEYALDGQSFSIDLTAANAEMFRENMKAIVDASTQVVPKRPSGKKAATAGTTAPPVARTAKKTAKGTNDETQKIRTWALANGFEISERGRLAAEVKDAYYAAMHQTPPGEVTADQLTSETPPEQLNFTSLADESAPNGQELPQTIDDPQAVERV
jgi:hypothetical protein